MRALADTSGLFAALVRNDRMHADAKPLFARLIEGESEIHITSYALLETLALLQSRVGRDAARAFEHSIRPLLRVAWVDEPLHKRAFHRLERIGVRSVSLVDCAGFEIMEASGIRHAFAYDPHFRDQGFILLQRIDDLGEEVGKVS